MKNRTVQIPWRCVIALGIAFGIAIIAAILDVMLLRSRRVVEPDPNVTLTTSSIIVDAAKPQTAPMNG